MKQSTVDSLFVAFMMTLAIFWGFDIIEVEWATMLGAVALTLVFSCYYVKHKRDEGSKTGRGE